MINIASYMPHTRSEGPGIRFAIWVQGCSLLCPGCCNPEMHSFAPVKLYTVEQLLDKIVEAECEGISLLGGEPFDQAEELGELAKKVQQQDKGVMVFSGYTLSHIQKFRKNEMLLQHADLLKAGPYIAALHSTRRRWIGSENQQLHYLSERYRDHPDILADHTQSVTIDLSEEGGMASGWPGFFDV